jgi:sulfhydrogenase subunit delta
MALPKLAVHKFASCDGCQLSLLDLEDELLAVAGVVQIANFMEASREVLPPPYDVTLVEGSVTTPHDRQRIMQIREETTVLITIGACATAGGIQALRNWKDVDDFTNYVYAHPEFIDTLQESTPISDYVKVDFELRGCPISKYQLLEVLVAFLQGRRPNIPTYSVCVECKAKGNPCVMVSHGTPCLGPITQAGCHALCPSYNRGCYGCFGPMESANAASLAGHFEWMGMSDAQIVNSLRGFNAWSEAFRKESDRREAAIEIGGAR